MDIQNQMLRAFEMVKTPVVATESKKREYSKKVIKENLAQAPIKVPNV